MIQVARELFTDGVPLAADVYTKMPSGNFLLIGKKGDKGAIQTMHATAEKKAETYVPASDYEALIQFNLNLIRQAVHNPQVSSQLKATLVKGLTDSTMNDLVERKVYIGTYDRIRQISDFMKDTLEQVKSIDRILDMLNRLPGDQVTHGMATAAVAILICEQMGISSKQTLEKIALGALIHDIGLKEVPVAIINKPRLERTEEETLQYESHTLRGAEILRELKEMPSDVLSIVMEHHENALGMGYPRQIRDIKINPLARIVGVANYFVELLFEKDTDQMSKSPDEVIKYMEETLGQPFNKQAFLALKQIINVTYLKSRIV